MRPLSQRINVLRRPLTRAVGSLGLAPPKKKGTLSGCPFAITSCLAEFTTLQEPVPEALLPQGPEPERWCPPVPPLPPRDGDARGGANDDALLGRPRSLPRSLLRDPQRPLHLPQTARPCSPRPAPKPLPAAPAGSPLQPARLPNPPAVPRPAPAVHPGSDHNPRATTNPRMPPPVPTV